MAKIKPEMSAFERQRLENIAANRAILQDLSTTASKITPAKPAPKPAAPRKRAASSTQPTAPRQSSRPSRTSSRLAGLEVDSEGAKRKAEAELELEKEVARAKRVRVVGDVELRDAVVEGGRWARGGKEGFLAGVMSGARPYERTFIVEEEVEGTADEGLKALRERMSGLQMYEGWDPNQIKITPERVYSLGFHPTADKPLIFAGDKMGNMGLFDASQTISDPDTSDDGDEQEPEPAVTAFKLHSRTISSFLFPDDPTCLYSASYDSSIRKLDLQKEVAVEVYAPQSLNDDEPISGIDMASSSAASSAASPHILYFSTLNGAFGRHDTRTPSHTATDLWPLSEKKIGGFSLHPRQPHLAATASLDRTLRIWDLRQVAGKGSASSRQPQLLGEHTSPLSVSHAAWSAAGHVATASYDNTVKIHHFPTAGDWKAGRDVILDDDAMEPTAVIRHNNQTGRWVTILKAQWQQRPADGIQKFVIGNMNRFVDVYTAEGEQLAQLGGDGITAVPAVAGFHPTRDWVAGGTASGKLCLWM